MDQKIFNQEMADDEFDKWLASQLKDSIVEPPKEFTNNVLMELSVQKYGAQFDPIMLIILISILVVNAFVIVLPYLLSLKWLQMAANALSFDTYSAIASVSTYIAFAVVLGIAFVFIDFFLSKKFEAESSNLA
jgi:hypothetical protein